MPAVSHVHTGMVESLHETDNLVVDAFSRKERKAVDEILSRLEQKFRDGIMASISLLDSIYVQNILQFLLLEPEFLNRLSAQVPQLPQSIVVIFHFCSLSCF